MRKPLWLALICLLTSLSAPSLPCGLEAARLEAQARRPGGEVGAFGGLLAFDRNFRVSDGVGFRSLKESPLFGARLGYAFSRLLSAEGSLTFSTHSLDASEQTGGAALDISYVTYLAEALASLGAGAATPFLAAGVGGLSLDVDADAATEDASSSGLFASIGGGIKFPLSKSLIARLDGRDLISRSSGRGVESLLGGVGDVRHNVAISAGVSFHFGGPGDEDADGVYDDRDDCPGTLPDAPVDETGCIPKIPEGPPPVKTDGDGDGVSDALDRCPDSPPGAVVDLEGCPVGGEGTNEEGTTSEGVTQEAPADEGLGDDGT
jgi:OOP family OmpA-OmpF porin